MRRQLCLFFLVSLAVLLVKSESSIEVDENGDEYDVKRFNIQGRQLNEGRSQCVVTRRKRATQPQPQAMYSNDGSNDEVEEQDADIETTMQADQPPRIFYVPPVDATGDDEEDGEDKEDEQNGMNKITKDKEEDETLNKMDDTKNKNEKTTEDEQPTDEDEGDDAIEVIQLPQLPILGQLQSDGESVAAIASASGDEDQSDTDGIVVVQSLAPPKVNHKTHALFELIPVSHDQEVDEDEVKDKSDKSVKPNENFNSDFDFHEEISPISTTAIWSTSDDNSKDTFNDYDANPVIVKRVQNTKKPLKSNKKNKKRIVKTKRKSQNNNNVRRGLTNGNKNKRPNNKRRPTKSKRPNKNRVVQTRRRVPNKSKPYVIRTPNNNPKRNPSQAASNNRYNNFNTRKRLISKRNKNKKNAEVIDNGENTFTRTYSWTKTGDEDNEGDVNCIIIRKDAPATTERPFWNIWGRSANSTPETSGHFGNRKRVNARFIA